MLAHTHNRAAILVQTEHRLLLILVTNSMPHHTLARHILEHEILATLDSCVCQEVRGLLGLKRAIFLPRGIIWTTVLAPQDASHVKILCHMKTLLNAARCVGQGIGLAKATSISLYRMYSHLKRTHPQQIVTQVQTCTTAEQKCLEISLIRHMPPIVSGECNCTVRVLMSVCVSY